MPRYWLETLGCPKNQVDSEKLVGRMEAQGHVPAPDPDGADLIVVNTCAFVEAAREESVGVVLDMARRRTAGAKVVVTGCMAERYGDELASAMDEVDLVAPFGVDPAVALGDPVALRGRGGRPRPSFDLLELPRPPASAPWAYVKVAEGCDRACGFCAIPSFRGRQRSRTLRAVLDEVDALGAQEVVLVAQDLASWGRDLRSEREAPQIGDLVRAVAERVGRVRLLYLYPSSVTPELIDVVCGTGVPYFDLSLQHASRPLLRQMRRWGDGDRFLSIANQIREADPHAALRSSFVVGYPGETEEDHDQLLEFLGEAQLDWAGFFPFSAEDGTFAAGLENQVDAELAAERLRECSELQDRITAERRESQVGSVIEVLVDAPGLARSTMEAPEIDGVVNVPSEMPVGSMEKVVVVGAEGPDLEAVPVGWRP